MYRPLRNCRALSARFAVDGGRQHGPADRPAQPADLDLDAAAPSGMTALKHAYLNVATGCSSNAVAAASELASSFMRASFFTEIGEFRTDVESKPIPLWDTSRVLLLLAGLLTLEWAVRKRFRLL